MTKKIISFSLFLILFYGLFSFTFVVAQETESEETASEEIVLGVEEGSESAPEELRRLIDDRNVELQAIQTAREELEKYRSLINSF